VSHPQADEQLRWAGPARMAFFTPIHHNPILADRKATFLLGALGLIATVLLVFSEAIGELIRSERQWVSVTCLVTLFLLVGLVVVGAINAWNGFILPVSPMPRSRAFFPHIAETSCEEYFGQMKGLDHAQAVRDVLNYNYSLAEQAVRKFRYVNRSFACFRVALVLWLGLLLVITLNG
jgi:hypothetical protein